MFDCRRKKKNCFHRHWQLGKISLNVFPWREFSGQTTICEWSQRRPKWRILWCLHRKYQTSKKKLAKNKRSSLFCHRHSDQVEIGLRYSLDGYNLVRFVSKNIIFSFTERASLCSGQALQSVVLFVYYHELSFILLMP